MYVNDRDQINYHGFLRALREMNQVPQEAVGKGICTVSGMNRFENGNRIAEKLMRDRLTARLGISGEKYEDYLQPKEYVRWEHRLRIVKAIEKKDYALARMELDAYKELPRLNCVNLQFVEAMHFMILSAENAPKEEQLACITNAVKCTIPNVAKALNGEHLLSDQEINLIAEYMRLCPAKKKVKDEFAWRISEYEKLIAYMDVSCWEKLQKAKVYPKVVYYICKLMLEGGMTEDHCRRGLQLCHQAIELLRDTRRLYYFIELTEMRRAFVERMMTCEEEQGQLSKMMDENNAWEEVLKELYKEYGVAPYMSDSCYLYYETECHDMVKVIETRRNMLGLSRVKLGEGICTDKTIIRFEREGRNPNIDLVRLLFERMGLCAEYRRARVITNDVEALMLILTLSKNVNNYDFNTAEAYLNELKNKLCMDISHNQQEVCRLDVVLKCKRDKVENAELHRLAKQSLEYTLPINALAKDGAKYLTRSEITCLFDLAIKTTGELSEKCLKILYEKYGKESKEDYLTEMEIYEFVTGGLVSRLGNSKRFEDSNRISHHVMKECLSYRRIGQMMSILYNIVWNYQNNTECNDWNIEYIKEILFKGYTISIITKNNYRIAFFQNKLLEYQ